MMTAIERQEPGLLVGMCWRKNSKTTAHDRMAQSVERSLVDQQVAGSKYFSAISFLQSICLITIN